MRLMLKSIQALRGVAAIFVMLFHFRAFLNTASPDFRLGDLIAQQGYMGVDIFFVLSGFIIAYSTQDAEHGNPWHFAARRALRVIPVAWTATLAFYLLTGGAHTKATLLQSLLFLPLSENQPPYFGYSLHAVVWTLTYELYFYTLFTFALLLSHRRRVVIATLLVLVNCLIMQYITTGAISVDPHQTGTLQHAIPFIPNRVLLLAVNPIALEFVIGMLLAQIYNWAKLNRARTIHFPLRAIGIGSFALFCVFAFSPIAAGHGVFNKGLGAVSLVVACLTAELSETSWIAPRWLVFSGAISYSLYLVHYGIVDKILKHLHIIEISHTETGAMYEFIVYTFASLVLATAAYHYVEIPLQRLGRRLLSREPRIGTSSAH
jgi:peptidoglycan/LPS O-acetylase OafA/YrhL